MGRPGEALIEYQAVLNGRRKTLGEYHPRTFVAWGAVGTCLMDVGKLDAAIDEFGRALQAAQKFLGIHHNRTLILWNNWIGCLLGPRG